MQLNLQDRATPTITILVSFHDLILIMIVLILTTISYIIVSIITNNLSSRTLKEAHRIEFI